MEKINDGGPAFPCVDAKGFVSEGMSLRDWLAGQALAGIGASDLEHSCIWQRFSDEVPGPDGISELCYMMADAMLKEKDTTRE